MKIALFKLSETRITTWLYHDWWIKRQLGIVKRIRAKEWWTTCTAGAAWCCWSQVLNFWKKWSTNNLVFTFRQDMPEKTLFEDLKKFKVPVIWKASSSQMMRFSNLFGMITPTYLPFIGWTHSYLFNLPAFTVSWIYLAHLKWPQLTIDDLKYPFWYIPLGRLDITAQISFSLISFESPIRISASVNLYAKNTFS